MCSTQEDNTNGSNEATLSSTTKGDALFSAVLVHDDLYPSVQLPDNIHLDYSQEQLTQCYQICLDVWQDGVKRKAFRRVVRKYYQLGTLGPEEQIEFRNIRAKFKHLRFAYASFTEKHQYPRLFHWLIVVLGYLQDATKNGQQKTVDASVTLLRFLLSKRAYALIIKKLKRFKPTTPEAFREHVCSEINFIRKNLDKKKVTGKVFHDMRKVVSQQVALYDNLKILFPSSYHKRISQYLSTINGMMGKLHDELVVKKFNKTQDYYHDLFIIPDEIKYRLSNFTHKYNSPVCRHQISN